MSKEINISLFQSVVVPHPCYNRPCLNGGICIDSYSGYSAYPDKWNHGFLHYLCICQAGFTGSNCEGKIRLAVTELVRNNNTSSSYLRHQDGDLSQSYINMY